MYIWIACDISDEYTSIRQKCIGYNKDLNLDEVAFLLPQHISLKISFRVEDNSFESVIKDVIVFLSECSPFSVGEPEPELSGNILWLSFPKSKHLQDLHSKLDLMLLSKHGVEQHPFDRDFKFHTTLFLDDNMSALREMLGKVRLLPLPKATEIKRFIIGASESGKAGTYSVLKIVNAKCK